jgi:hypothetical protein
MNPDAPLAIYEAYEGGGVRNEPEGVSEIYGLQRRLDVPWHRMAYSMLSHHHAQSDAVERYLRALYKNQDQHVTIPPELKESALSSSSVPIPDAVLGVAEDGKLTFLYSIERIANELEKAASETEGAN